MPSLTTLLQKTIEADLIRDERYRDKPYKDSTGNLTIGVGHNLEAKGLCSAAILAQLDFDMQEVLAELDRLIPWWQDKPAGVKRALVNLGFNLGVSKLVREFPITVGRIRDGHYASAATALEHSQPWASQVGNRAVRICGWIRECQN